MHYNVKCSQKLFEVKFSLGFESLDQREKFWDLADSEEYEVIIEKAYFTSQTESLNLQMTEFAAENGIKANPFANSTPVYSYLSSYLYQITLEAELVISDDKDNKLTVGQSKVEFKDDSHEEITIDEFVNIEKLVAGKSSYSFCVQDGYGYYNIDIAVEKGFSTEGLFDTIMAAFEFPDHDNDVIISGHNGFIVYDVSNEFEFVL